MVSMLVSRIGVGLAAALALASGCSDGGGAATTPESNQSESWADLDPPANVDIAVCSSIIDDGDAARVSECYDCCSTNGFGSSTFINQGQCTCAEVRPPDPTTCAASTGDSQQCLNCCQAAGYLWSDYTGSDTPTCTCDMLNDPTSCESTVTRVKPADQCALCCLNHGFITAGYTAAEEPECACS
jgi:hypothetical protein